MSGNICRNDSIPAEVLEQSELGDIEYRMNILCGHLKKTFLDLLRLHYLFS